MKMYRYYLNNLISPSDQRRTAEVATKIIIGPGEYLYENPGLLGGFLLAIPSGGTTVLIAGISLMALQTTKDASYAYNAYKAAFESQVQLLMQV